jgi:hypothetical protein
MAIAPATTETGYALAGTGVGPFGTIWPYEQASDVKVYLTQGGVTTLLASGSDYTLAGATPLAGGGQVTLNAALPGAGWASGASLDIKRRTEVDQPSTFGEALGFSPAAAEAAMDHLARQVQDLWTTLTLDGGGAVGGGGPISSLDWSQLTGIPATWPGAVSWASITGIPATWPGAVSWASISGRPGAWPGTLPWASLTAVPSVVATIAALGAPGAGQIIEFTSASSAHFISTPSGGGGGGGGSMQPQELSAFGSVDATGATTTGNDAAIAAAEAAADSAVYLRDGAYAKTPGATTGANLTKRYQGRGVWKEGTAILPADFSAMHAKPTTAATQGLTGWFAGDQRFTEQSYHIVGSDVRSFDISSTHRYYESNTIPRNRWLDALGGSSGVQAWLTAGAAAGATVIALAQAADASWVGKTVVFSDTEGGAATDTKTVTAVNTAGNNITVNTALATTYTWNPGAGHTPNIRFALRTWHGDTYLKLHASGGGDFYGHNVRVTADNVGYATQVHPFMKQTASQYGGDVNAGAAGVYLQSWESQLLDNGYPVSAIAFVQSFTRTVDASITDGTTWQGTFFQSTGSRPADVAHNVLGFWRIGLDLAFATLYETAALTGNTAPGATSFPVNSINGAHPNDTMTIGSEVLTIQTATGTTITTTGGAASGHSSGDLVTYGQGGAAINMAKGHRLVFGSTPNGAYRGGDPLGVFSTPYGNKQGDIFLDSGTLGSSDYLAMRIARGASAATPDIARIRVKGDNLGNGIVQIYGTGTHTIAGLGLGFTAGCNINHSLGNNINWGACYIYSDGAHIYATNNGGSSFVTLV